MTDIPNLADIAKQSVADTTERLKRLSDDGIFMLSVSDAYEYYAKAFKKSVPELTQDEKRLAVLHALLDK